MSASFNDRLSQRARDTSRPALAHQSRGRPLRDPESEFAAALMEIYGDNIHDFDAVCEQLRERSVPAPCSGRTDWDRDLLEKELQQINDELDKAYEANGYGA